MSVLKRNILAAVAVMALLLPVPCWGQETETPGGQSIEHRQRRVFPEGVGVWKYENQPQEMMPWMKANGLTWMQFWSGSYRTRGLPYIFEAKVGAWGLETCKKWVEAKAADPDFFGVNINCEVGWTGGTEFARWLKEKHPRLVTMSGPLFHMPEPGDERWANVDAVMTFYRVSGPDRFPADIWYTLGLAQALGKPVCIGVQPVIGYSDDKPILADARDFSAALDIAAHADGLIIWAADRLWKYATGASELTNPEQYEPIMAAVKAVNQNHPALPCKFVLYPTDTFESGGPDTTKRFNKARCLGRCVGQAGFLPVFTTDATKAQISWDTLPKPDGYAMAVFFLYDTGHPSRPADIKDQVAGFEREISQSLKQPPYAENGP